MGKMTFSLQWVSRRSRAGCVPRVTPGTVRACTMFPGSLAVLLVIPVFPLFLVSLAMFPVSFTFPVSLVFPMSLVFPVSLATTQDHVPL